MILMGGLSRARRGATALEFGLVASIFLPLCLGIIGGGLLMWTKAALQSAAALTARCTAIQSTRCTDIAEFAVAQAATWTFPGIIAPADVHHSVVCRSTVPFVKVTIICRFWAGSVLPPPLNRITLDANAYFPASAPSCP
jgi:Flp pilus assembly protein TadG